MFKRISCIMICAALIFACGCKKTEKNEKKQNSFTAIGHLTELPDYSLSEGATVDEMRQTAVRAMLDGLSFRWFTGKDFTYSKIGPAADTPFVFKKDTVYCGLPYSNGGTGLLHFLQYYDFSSGELDYSVTKNFNRILGSDCSTSVVWAWNTVCPDIMWDETVNMTPANGCIPVKGYTHETINSTYHGNATRIICDKNGQQAMYTAYSNTLPADALTVYTETDGHTMMVMAKPVTVKDANGNIDGEKSYLFIADQQAGTKSTNTSDYIIEEDGQLHHYSGRTGVMYTFGQLFTKGFIPLTTTQFQGEKPYEKATVTLDGKKPDKFSALLKSSVSSNYNIVSVKATAYSGKSVAAENNFLLTASYWDKTQNKIASKKRLTCCALSGKKGGALENAKIKEVFSDGKPHRIKIEVTVATGETLTAFDGKIR